MAEHDFNTLMAALDSPLIVVTTADERERAGCLVEFHVQSSIEPQRYSVWLSKANYTYRVALQSSHLVIHFLTADDLPLAELFGTQTGDTVDKFAGLAVDSGPGGAPVLRQCPNWLAVRRIALFDAHPGNFFHANGMTIPIDGILAEITADAEHNWLLQHIAS